MIRVQCTLTDCIHYNVPRSATAGKGQCDCAHPEKKDYMKNKTCPLYKKDWMQTGGDVAGDLKDRFRRKRTVS